MLKGKSVLFRRVSRFPLLRAIRAYWLVALWCCIGFVSQSLHAQELEVKFSFVKKPPRVGLIYAADGSSDQIKALDVDQKNKEFDSMVYVTTKDTSVNFKNSDDMDHNIYARPDGSWSGFDIGLISPGANQMSTVDFPAESFLRMRCKIHPKMRAYFAEIPNSVYQAFEFKKDGLKDVYIFKVPSDTVKVGLLFPSYDKLVLDIQSGSATAKLIKKGQEKGEVSVTRK